MTVFMPEAAQVDAFLAQQRCSAGTLHSSMHCIQCCFVAAWNWQVASAVCSFLLEVSA